ncbi:MAG: purine-binding chemotaxis protein CheW [Deltaproteobacteria bacterium]|nr:purine-binding chemotaxis protein CheW [Deltaproteobacteria bacterium]
METSGTQNIEASVDQGKLSGRLAGKYLTFNLGGGQYGVEILRVQEIIGIQPITHVPKSPEYIKGVINLRGKIIPVLDLRLKLDMQPEEYTAQTCIIVLNIAVEDQLIAVGVVVDSVREVYDFDAEQIESAPKFGSDMDTSAILGMGKIGESVVMLLDISEALSQTDKAILSKVKNPN